MVETTPELAPHALLQAYEARALAASASLPEMPAQAGRWRGIGFRVASERLVIEMVDVREVLNVPRTSRVPGTRSWLLGLASLRGALLPVVDLGGFLCGRAAPFGRDARVLVIQDGGVLVGLQVEEVFGLQQFDEHTLTEDRPGACPWLRPFVRRGFAADETRWGVFDVHTLLRTDEFLHAAA